MTGTKDRTPIEETYGVLQKAYDFFNERLFDGELPSCLITLQRKSNAMGYYAKKRFYNKKTGTDLVDEIALNPEWFQFVDPIEIMACLCHEQCHLWQAKYGHPSRGGYHNREWADKMISIGLMPSHNGEEGGDQVGQQMSDYYIEGGPFELAYRELFPDDDPLTWYDYWALIKRTKKEKAATLRDVIKNKYGSGKIKQTKVELIQSKSNEKIPVNDPLISEALQKKEKNFVGPKKELHIVEKIPEKDLRTLVKTTGNRMKYTCGGCGANVWGKIGLSIICANCAVDFSYNIDVKKK